MAHRHFQNRNHQSAWDSYALHSGGGLSSDHFAAPASRVAAIEIAASKKTAAIINSNGTYSSSIDKVGDVDWIKVNLVEGESYFIEQRGSETGNGTLWDPLLKGLYNLAGKYIPGTGNDDYYGNGSYDSGFIFTATSTASYYIAAAAYGKNKGSYQVRVTELIDNTAPTLDSLSPGSGDRGVAIGANIKLVFSEEIKAGTGTIVLSANNQSLSFSMSDTSQVSIAGNTLTINPSNNFAVDTDYTVSIGAGIVTDLAGNAFAGVSSQFTTQTNNVTDAKSWTIMVYIAGDNNLESFGVSDINEMESVSLPANVKVTTMFDRTSGYDRTNGNWTDARQATVVYDGNSSTLKSLPAFTSIGEVNTGNPDTLKNFINWSASANPADHYMLVVWNHGGGLDGAAWDDSNNSDFLSLKELKTGVEASSVTHFDVIGFDACLMAMAEQVYDFSTLTDYVVASQELEPGNGWDYKNWLSTFANNTSVSAPTLATAAVDTYCDQYSESDITLSVVSTSAFATVTTELQQFVSAALALPSSSADWTAMRRAAANAREYPSGDNSYGYADLGQFMATIATNAASSSLKMEASQVAAAVDAAVIHESGSVSQATGLSIYLPESGITSLNGWYSETNFSFLAGVNWDDFLLAL